MIYFDAGATTLQKPPQVGQAVAMAINQVASASRGGYGAAEQAASILFDCRMALAALFSLENPEQVVFTCNATHGLNIALRTLITHGDRVVISGYEHNAVTRPLSAIGAQIEVAGAPLFDPDGVIEAYETHLKSGCKVAVVNHVSNVFGFVQPVEDIAKLCQSYGAKLIIDASQSAGVLRLDMGTLGADFIAMPGHKGLYGPQGTGVLLCGNDVKVKSLLQGGTGGNSILQTMPEFLPDGLEAGTHNVCGIAGLLEGVSYVQEVGVAAICHHERTLAQRLALGLRKLEGVEVYARPDLFAQTGVVSFVVAQIDCETVAQTLAQREIAVRSGLHCAPMAHKTAGTLETGTIRASLSQFNTEREVVAFVDVVGEIVEKNKKFL
ncbi:aminotransferase class V-fold PLP-dependent enzyme [Bengtsoniella intestinalis]|uniref:aminotransferase class V-fold PLP-dependent enzyme n=1 Tax=Bengtsoniella intestinalis TaxID=3073143 RepID=UPI00391F0126